MSDEPVNGSSRRFSSTRLYWGAGLLSVSLLLMLGLRIGIPAYQERAAVAEIERLGGSADAYIWKLTPESWSDNRYDLPMGLFKEPYYVILQGSHITDGELALLRPLPSVVSLYLTDAHVTDAGVQVLAGLSARWRGLEFQGTEITDAGLATIGEFHELRFLGLKGTKVTDAGIAHLESLSELVELDLTRTQVTGRCLTSLSRLPKLAHLNLTGVALQDDELAVLASFPALTKLTLDDTAIGDRGLQHVARVPGLTELSISGTRITDAAFEEVGKVTLLKSLRVARTALSKERLGRKYCGEYPGVRVEY